MKLFINARFLTQPVSGVQRYGIECSRQIKMLNKETIFCTPPGIIHHEIAEELGAIVVGRRNGHFWEQFDLPAYLGKLGNPPLLNLANTGPLAYQNNFVTIHDLAFFHHPEWNSYWFSAWYNFMVPRLAKNSRHIFTVSEAMKEEIIRNYKVAPGKIDVTCNGISSDLITTHLGDDIAKEKVILTVGTFNIRKNQHNLVKAFLESEIKHSYRLVLIGDKNKVFRESGIDAAKIEGANIIVLNSLTVEELKSWYQRAEIVVSLSEYEGFGIPLLEGLYFRCKILCSDIPVYREVYDGFATYCNPHDIGGIAMALNNMAGRAPSYGKDSINLLLEKYNYEKAAKVLLGIVFNDNELDKL